VLVDIDLADLHLDLDELRDAHGQSPIHALVLPQLFGWCSARTREVRALCAAEGIALVEDGAQAFGVELEGEPLFAASPMSTLSFYPAKVLGGASDGGAITCQDAQVGARLRALRNHGRAAHYRFVEVGWNARMSSPNAAFLRRMLARRGALLESRRSALARYTARLAEEPRITLHVPPPRVLGNGYLCVVTVDGVGGDALAAGLRSRAIGCARTYPETIDAQLPALEAARTSGLARSRAFCADVVNLPLFAGITDDEVDESADALLAVIDSL
jgi:dTDP-4-amino-4,6-dideoxygalactose transaminase